MTDQVMLASPYSRREGARLTLIVSTTLLSIAAIVATLRDGLQHPMIALAFAGLIVLGETLRVRLPNGRDASPIGMAGALGYGLIFNVGGTRIDHPLYQVIAVAAVAMVAGAVPHALAGRSIWPGDIARRLLLVSAVAVSFQELAPIWFPDVGDTSQLRWIALLMALVVVVASLADAALTAGLRSLLAHAPFRPMLSDELRGALGLGLAMGATGVLIALATPSMHLYALPIFCVPLVLTQFAFRRYAAIRTTYRQTIRSLAQVTEVAGYVTDGHSRRVAELAGALGRELGLDSQRLLDLEYAALMHDIGQISLYDPIGGGSTLAVTPAGRQRLAELGADIIRTTGVLDRVAVLVGRQAEPYRRHREAPDASLPLESRIIKVASAYDDVVGDDTSWEARADGLERLRLGMVFDYDPRVVEALPRVLRRLDGRTRQFQF